jgi:large subunit ribosomal protein L10
MADGYWKGERVPTARKAAVIEDLTEKLTRANAAALIDYRGLTVAEISELRRQLRQREVELEVTKNTLLREAAHRNDMMELDELFVGPTAVAFIYGDEPTGTKALNDFFRTARVGEIKSGILKGGRRLTAQEFARLAELPSRQTLLAQIAGLLQSPMAQLAALFNAPAQQFAYAFNALIEKGGAGGENGAGGAGVHAGVPETPGGAPEAAADAEPPAPETA